MKPYLKLIQYDNLLILAFAQFCIKYGLFKTIEIATALHTLDFTLLAIATVCIAAGGNIIIAIYDRDTTSENIMFQNISDKIINTLFIVLNCIGVLIGFYLSNRIGKPGFIALFIIVSGLFYIYATFLKDIIILKNTIPAFLIALSIIVVGILDLLPVITKENKQLQTTIFSIIVDYSVFAFAIVMIRELIKDCIHIDQDHNLKTKTIPIILGKKRTLKLIGLFTIIPIAMVVHYVYTYLFLNNKAIGFALLCIIAPLLLFMIKCFIVVSKKQLIMLKLILKIILLIAATSLLFYPYILH